MKKYIVLLSIIVVLILAFFITEDLRVGNVVQEAIIKEVIPYEVSKAFSVPYKRISIIESGRMGKEWMCYFFALTSEQSNEFFIAAVFDPPKEARDQVDFLVVTEEVASAYLLKIIGLKQANVSGVEVLRSKQIGFLVLRLKRARINGKPLREYL